MLKYIDEYDTFTSHINITLEIDGRETDIYGKLSLSPDYPDNKNVLFITECNGVSQTLNKTGYYEDISYNYCGDYSDTVELKASTNIELPKWDDWFNDAEILLEFRNDTAGINIQSGLNIGDQDWMTEMKRADELMGLSTWILYETDFMKIVDEIETETETDTDTETEIVSFRGQDRTD